MSSPSVTSSPSVAPAPAARRGPGRPRKTEDEKEYARAHIVAATERVFARHVYRDVTVTRIIAEANLTRPSFYRSFANADEPLRIVLEEFTGSLARDLMTALAAPEADGRRLAAGLDAYLAWAARNRHLLRSVFADLHNPSSPVSGMRDTGIQAVVSIIEHEFETLDGPTPDRMLVDVYANGVEYTCYRFLLGTDGGPEALAEARTLMLRMAGAVFGGTRRAIVPEA